MKDLRKDVERLLSGSLREVFNEWDNPRRLMPSTESMEALRSDVRRLVEAHDLGGAS